ncbi:TPA: hypothetical protein OQQ69_002845 [Shigella boydii]|nr:hypothetical protein [Shigella boydii]
MRSAAIQVCALDYFCRNESVIDTATQRHSDTATQKIIIQPGCHFARSSAHITSQIETEFIGYWYIVITGQWLVQTFYRFINRFFAQHVSAEATEQQNKKTGVPASHNHVLMFVFFLANSL